MKVDHQSDGVFFGAVIFKLFLEMNSALTTDAQQMSKRRVTAISKMFNISYKRSSEQLLMHTIIF